MGEYCAKRNPNVTFKENCVVKFMNNVANQNGGAIYYVNSTNAIFEQHATVILDESFAGNNGDAICLSKFSTIIFDKNSRSNVTFSNNKADQGGAIHSDDNSRSKFDGHSTVLFTKNQASLGGVAYCYNSKLSFNGYVMATFNHNNATFGGVIYSENNSTVIFQQNSNTIFIRAIYLTLYLTWWSNIQQN